MRSIDFERFLVHNLVMLSEKRQSPRYKVLGRMLCNELSPLHGSLIDVSQTGCQVYYTVPVNVQLENDYTFLFQSSDSEGYNITLICHPAWVKEDSGKTLVGLEVLRSPDSEKFNRYIEYLDRTREAAEEYNSQIVDTQCQFL